MKAVLIFGEFSRNPGEARFDPLALLECGILWSPRAAQGRRMETSGHVSSQTLGCCQALPAGSGESGFRRAWRRR